MSTLATQYAEALQEVAHTRESEAVAFTERLIAHLKATGRLKLLPEIKRAYVRLVERNTAQGVLLEVASVEEKAAAEISAKEAGLDSTQTSVNPALIRGWRARSKGVLVDRSGKRALIDLYRNITKA